MSQVVVAFAQDAQNPTNLSVNALTKLLKGVRPLPSIMGSGNLSPARFIITCKDNSSLHQSIVVLKKYGYRCKVAGLNASDQNNGVEDDIGDGWNGSCSNRMDLQFLEKSGNKMDTCQLGNGQFEENRGKKADYEKQKTSSTDKRNSDASAHTNKEVLLSFSQKNDASYKAEGLKIKSGSSRYKSKRNNPNHINVAIANPGNIRFVRISNINTEEVDACMLFNLLNLYGNAIKILFNQSNRPSIVEMDKPISASFVCDRLNGCKLFNSTLSVELFDYEFSWETVYVDPNSDVKIINSNPKYFRFKKNSTYQFNGESTAIKVSNMSAAVKFSQICELFSSVSSPVSVCKLGSNGKSCDYLLEFETEEEALEGLITYHNQAIHGLKLNIQFSYNHARLPAHCNSQQ